jgi:septum formation protein
MTAEPKLVLASASPRRLSLLAQAGLRPHLLNPADVDETPHRRETPRAFALRMAEEKARAASSAPAVRGLEGDVFVLAADTVVAVGRRILGKPSGREEAREMLRLLSGRAHTVWTGVALVTPRGALRTRLVDTKVRFKRLSREELDAYLETDEWRGKAGAYAIQGRAGVFVRHINGSYTGVVGLPLYETVSLLAGNGYPVLEAWSGMPAEDVTT